jgi:glutaredoxin 3
LKKPERHPPELQEKRSFMQAVKMYTTAVCPFCIRAKQVLKAKGVETIQEIRIDTDPAQRDHMMQITGRRTVPQIFIGDTHVGGCDDLIALDGKGELIPLLQAA